LRGTRANTTTISSLAKKAGDASIAGFHSACSNERGRKDECGDDKPSTEGRVSSKKPIHYGCGQKGK